MVTKRYFVVLVSTPECECGECTLCEPKPPKVLPIVRLELRRSSSCAALRAGEGSEQDRVEFVVAMASSSGGRCGSVSTPASNAVFLFHLLSFLMYLYIFCWHFSKQASTLPQAWDFGWFFKFLTFCAFSFQTIALLTSLLSHLFPEAKVMKRTANDLSCASFEIANVVTLMYWAVTFWTTDPFKMGWQKAARKTLRQGLMSGAPLWLLLVVNVGNAGIAWTDILITERTFRRLSLYITFLFEAFYIFWVHLCEARNEVCYYPWKDLPRTYYPWREISRWKSERWSREFPYPFTRPLRQPEGTIAISAIAFGFIMLFHKIGSKLASRGSSPLARKIKLG